MSMAGASASTSAASVTMATSAPALATTALDRPVQRPWMPDDKHWSDAWRWASRGRHGHSHAHLHEDENGWLRFAVPPHLCLPVSSRTNATVLSDVRNFKQALCRDFELSNGRHCYRNKRCSFAHGRVELRLQSTFSPVGGIDVYKKHECSNMKRMGRCQYSEQCRFFHSLDEARLRAHPGEGGEEGEWVV